eukprot:SAG31_NODE_2192_length_6226_cov_6.328219_1_plen_38_part_10
MLNEDDKVLLVQEAVGPAAAKNVWKLVTVRAVTLSFLC